MASVEQFLEQLFLSSLFIQVLIVFLLQILYIDTSVTSNNWDPARGWFHQCFYEQLLCEQIPRAQKGTDAFTVFCSFEICVCKMLMKLTPDDHIPLHDYFLSYQGSISPIFYKQLIQAKIPKVKKTLVTLLSFWAFGICMNKSCV